MSMEFIKKYLWNVWAVAGVGVFYGSNLLDWRWWAFLMPLLVFVTIRIDYEIDKVKRKKTFSESAGVRIHGSMGRRNVIKGSNTVERIEVKMFDSSGNVHLTTWDIIEWQKVNHHKTFKNRLNCLRNGLAVIMEETLRTVHFVEKKHTHNSAAYQLRKHYYE